MTLTRNQKKRRLSEPVSKTVRRNRTKARNLRLRKEREEKISQYLVSKGWSLTPRGNWSIPNWQKDGNCIRTLYQANKIQMKLDSESSIKPIKPIQMDEDLSSNLLEV